MKLINQVVDVMKCSPELFIKTYMDLNHVAAIHMGLNSWIKARESSFMFGDSWSMQMAPFNNGVPKKGAYLKYADEWNKNHKDAPTFGAIWFCSYPYGMIEQYPGLIVNSKLEEMKDQLINTIDFYAPMDYEILATAAMEAYLETAHEDMVAVENLQFDVDFNLKTTGTFHPILPSGVKHWKTWMEANRGE